MPKWFTKNHFGIFFVKVFLWTCCHFHQSQNFFEILPSPIVSTCRCHLEQRWHVLGNQVSIGRCHLCLKSSFHWTKPPAPIVSTCRCHLGQRWHVLGNQVSIGQCHPLGLKKFPLNAIGTQAPIVSTCQCHLEQRWHGLGNKVSIGWCHLCLKSSFHWTMPPARIDKFPLNAIGTRAPIVSTSRCHLEQRWHVLGNQVSIGQCHPLGLKKFPLNAIGTRAPMVSTCRCHLEQRWHGLGNLVSIGQCHLCLKSSFHWTKPPAPSTETFPLNAIGTQAPIVSTCRCHLEQRWHGLGNLVSIGQCHP